MADNDNYRGVGRRVNNVQPRNPNPPRQRKDFIQAPLAQRLAELTQSGANRPPEMSGPVNNLYNIEHPGPVELVWTKIIDFLNELEHVDIINFSNDFKIQAYHYSLPRFVQFRVQIFQQQGRVIVEFQRREGDVYLHNVLFQHLRALLTSTDSQATANFSPYEMLEPERVEEYTQVDLSRSENDLQHWLALLNQPNLNSARSASSSIALATQNEQNHPILMTEAEQILTGMNNVFEHSEDAPTMFACSVILSSLAARPEWCMAIIKTNSVTQIIAQIEKWCGMKKLKSRQVVTNLLLTLRLCVEQLGAESFGRMISNEDFDRLFALSKELDTEMGVLLESVLSKLRNDEQPE